MAYTSIYPSRREKPLFVPADHAEDQTWRGGVETLAEAAIPFYNRAVAAYRRRDVPAAHAAIEEALRLCPYSQRMVDFGLLLMLQHGYYGRAQRLIAHLRRLGQDDVAEAYADERARRAARWTTYRAHPERLRAKYAASEPNACYRELLLLADRFGDRLTSTERRHLAAYGLGDAARETVGAEPVSRPDVGPLLYGALAGGLAWLVGSGIKALRGTG